MGLACATKSGKEFLIEAIKVRLVNTHGAGDEFTGVLAAEIARGTGMEDALRAANHAAAVLVSTPRDTVQELKFGCSPKRDAYAHHHCCGHLPAKRA
ncbi:PfkB family carbohydrate kinase [Rhizobium gallicum]|uniref:PfkB family carbohydrate kinase n=1 Tax=Rhizobium gallicum TaxID=56730 RepID=UPI0009F949DE|nr:PfkB family carbohydrate kinase [Rhizobium gallicum]